MSFSGLLVYCLDTLTLTVTEIHPMTYGQVQGYRFFQVTSLKSSISQMTTTTLRRPKCSIINRIIFIFPCPLHAIAFKKEKHCPKKRISCNFSPVQPRGSWAIKVVPKHAKVFQTYVYKGCHVRSIILIKMHQNLNPQIKCNELFLLKHILQDYVE